MADIPVSDVGMAEYASNQKRGFLIRQYEKAIAINEGFGIIELNLHRTVPFVLVIGSHAKE
jgi:hypothetical protein